MDANINELRGARQGIMHGWFPAVRIQINLHPQLITFAPRRLSNTLKPVPDHVNVLAFQLEREYGPHCINTAYYTFR